MGRAALATRAAVAALLAAGLAAAGADPPTPGEPDAEQIYAKVLENRFGSSIQELAIGSGDRAGNVQPIRVQMLWRRYPEGSEERGEGVLSRTVVRYLEPPEVRRTGYLVVNREGLPNDQFVYLQSLRRVRRINLRAETLAGTDLAVEDVVPRELDDASYVRIADEDIDGTPCFVIEAIPSEEADSRYAKFRIYVEKSHFVPLRTRYWDRAGVEVKELRSPPDSLREFDGVWMPVRARMRNLLEGGFTTLEVVALVANPDLPDRFFSIRQIESRRLKIPKAYLADLREISHGP